MGEDDGETEITVTAEIDGAAQFPGATTVRVSVGGGTATSTDDYGAVTSFDVTIGAGEESGTATFDFTPAPDTLAEGDETVDVTGVSGALTITRDTITIDDAETAPTGITLTVSPDEVGEDDGETEITVTAEIDGAAQFPGATTVRVSVGGGTATSTDDYGAVTSFDVTIGAGEESGTATFDFTPAPDTLAEGDETVDVTGVSGALTITRDTITIDDAETAPTGITLTVSPDEVGEDDGETEITVTAEIDGAAQFPGATTVRVSVGGGTATSTDDYGAVTSFDVTIGAGEESGTATFDFTPAPDTLAEGDETVDVTGVSGALTITRDTITIDDAETAPTGITLTVSPDEVGEDDGETEITVTAEIDGAAQFPGATTVRVSVGGGTATSTDDYGAVTSFDVTIGAAGGERDRHFRLHSRTRHPGGGGRDRGRYGRVGRSDDHQGHYHH